MIRQDDALILRQQLRPRRKEGMFKEIEGHGAGVYGACEALGRPIYWRWPGVIDSGSMRYVIARPLLALIDEWPAEMYIRTRGLESRLNCRLVQTLDERCRGGHEAEQLLITVDVAVGQEGSGRLSPCLVHSLRRSL